MGQSWIEFHAGTKELGKDGGRVGFDWRSIINMDNTITDSEE